MAFDKQASGAAARVVDGVARLGIEDAGHDNADLGRRESLATALPLAFSEFSQQILIGPTQDVRLNIIQAELVVRVVHDLNEGSEATIVHDALSGSSGIEVGDVHDTG